MFSINIFCHFKNLNLPGEAAVEATTVAGPAATAGTEGGIDQDLVIVDLAIDLTPGTENLPDVTEAPPTTEADLDPRAGADLDNLFRKEDNFVF